MNNNISIFEAATSKLSTIISELEAQASNTKIKNAIEEIKIAQDWITDAIEDEK